MTNAYGMIMITLGFILSGCSSVSETFDSGPGKGVGVKSITEVNQMVDRGELAGIAEEKRGGGDASSLALAPEISSFPVSSQIHRYPEQVLRVGIAPFQDDQGNFHEASRIHTVIRQGAWQVKPEIR